MSCSCKKLNGYIISKCGYHYDKRKTIFQLYKKVRLELAALKAKELDTAHNTGSPKLLLRCRDYIAGVSGRSIKGDELLNELNEQLRAGA